MLARYSLPAMKEVWSEESKYKKWLEIELAICQARAKLGELSPQVVEKMKARVELNIPRIKEIESETRHDMLAFIEGISETLGEEAKYIHQGVTSSDIKDTARALQIQEALVIILDDLRELEQTLLTGAGEHKYTIMAGRTHGVHAEPVTWGLKLALWLEEIRRHIKRIRQVKEITGVGQISGAVGTYSTIEPRVEEFVCEKLGLKPSPVTNQILQRDRHADLINNLALIASSLEKFTTEIRNLQRTDILEVEEGFRRGQKGSSAMPHKKNPIVCERISGLARVVRSNVIPGLEDITLWHERDLTHSSVERVILPDSTILVDYMLQKFTMVLKELKINKDNMKENLGQTRGLMFSQQIMLALVEKGLSREKAYHLAQRNALQSWDKKEDYRKLLAGDEEISQYLSGPELEAIFDYNNFLKEIEIIYERLGI